MNNQVVKVGGQDIKVHGQKLERGQKGHDPETSAVNFSGTSESNVGKMVVFLLRSEVFGRVFSPHDGEFCNEFHCGTILHEDEDSFIIGWAETGEGKYVMKYPELYSFFRIVDSSDEVDAIEDMVINYADKLFQMVGGVWPFDVNMIEELEAALGGEGCKTSVAEQQQVLEKLKQTKFQSFRELS